MSRPEDFDEMTEKNLLDMSCKSNIDSAQDAEDIISDVKYLYNSQIKNNKDKVSFMLSINISFKFSLYLTLKFS